MSQAGPVDASVDRLFFRLADAKRFPFVLSVISQIGTHNRDNVLAPIGDQVVCVARKASQTFRKAEVF